MRLLVIQPGARYSTGDMYQGFIRILKQRHEVIEYRLDTRVQQADHYLTFSWRQAERARKAKLRVIQEADGAADVSAFSEPIPKPTMAEAVRYGSMTMLEAALSTLPDWCIVFSGMFLHPDAQICLYRAGCPTAIMLTESPYDDAMQRRLIAHCDIAFTNERASVPVLRAESFFNDDPKEARVAGNSRTYYMPHAYDPEVHNPDNRLENEDELPRHDVVFVGSGFSERMEILKTVDWEGLGIDLGLYGQWPYLHKNDRLYKYIKGGVTDNRLTAALYRNARVGLNIYRQSVGQSKNATRLRGAESLNPRALELAAIGVPHVSDVRPEVSEVFGDLVPTFDPYIRPRDPDTDGSLARAVVDLLHNSAHQKRMREELPERVREWTFDKRVDLLEAQMAAFMREGRAPLVTPVNSQLILPGR